MAEPDLNRERIQQIIAELDQLIPLDGALVSFDLSFHKKVPRPSRILGNSLGFLRLGVELAKAAYAPYLSAAMNGSPEQTLRDNPDAYAGIDASLSELTARGSHNVNSLTRRETLPPPEPELPQKPIKRLVNASIAVWAFLWMSLTLLGATSLAIRFWTWIRGNQ